MHGQRNSHIGWTCVTFLLSDFSNVLSNCLRQWLYSHIGCISLSLLFSCLPHYCSECQMSERVVSILMTNCWLANFVSLIFGHLRWNSLLLSSSFNSDAAVAWYKFLNLQMFNLFKQQIISKKAKIPPKCLNKFFQKVQKEFSPQKCHRRSEDSTLLPHFRVFPWQQGNEHRAGNVIFDC